MRYILGDFLKAKGLTCWRELFDIVIVSAMKPHFYTRMAAFRKINLDNEGPPIDYVPVQSFKKVRASPPWLIRRPGPTHG